jgi:hypothetical protein
MSGDSGVNTACSTIDGGVTWLQLTTPFNNPGIEYSPTLNLYTGIDCGGTDVYTSVSGSDVSWVVGTSFDGVFDSQPIYVEFFERFYASTTNSNFRVASSTNGSSYSQQSSTRSFFNLAFLPTLNRIVTVGVSGPQYSDDGLTWTNSSSSASMFSVCYSGFWKKLFAVPRNGDRTLIYYSSDGIIWESKSAGFGTIVNLRSIAWSDQYQIFMASGDASVFWISKDGFIWKQCVYNFTISSYASRFYPQWGNFIACGDGHAAAITPPIFIP